MLYMNCPGIGKLEQQAATALDLPAFSEVEYSNQIAEVFRASGTRSGASLAAYWFASWLQTTERYTTLPHEALFHAVMPGNLDRTIGRDHDRTPVPTPRLSHRTHI